MIIYTATPAEWESIKQQKLFSSFSLASEGFVHCCYPEQVLWVLNKHFLEENTVWLLCIEEQKLTSELRIEDLGGWGEKFPHVYGDINMNAVVQKVMMSREPGGQYSLSEELKLLRR